MVILQQTLFPRLVWPFLRPHIEKIVSGKGIDIVDSGEAVARRVEWLLKRYKIAARSDHKAEYRFISFAKEEYRKAMEERGRRILNEVKTER